MNFDQQSLFSGGPHAGDENFRARGNAYLKLWYCCYYVIDDGTHEVVRWKKRPLFRTPGSASHFNHVDGNSLYWKKSDKYRVHLGELFPCVKFNTEWVKKWCRQ